MAGMLPNTPLIRFALPLGVALTLAACSGAGPGWTYAPLGPTPAPTQATSPTPAASSDVTLQVKSTGNELVFDPAMLEAPAGKVVLVTYTNDSNLPHNINFFNGADATAPSLGKTEVKPGPGDVQSVTFTAPTTPGDYFFWCDVHGNQMTGTLHVTP